MCVLATVIQVKPVCKYKDVDAVGSGETRDSGDM